MSVNFVHTPCAATERVRRMRYAHARGLLPSEIDERQYRAYEALSASSIGSGHSDRFIAMSAMVTGPGLLTIPPSGPPTFGPIESFTGVAFHGATRVVVIP